MNNSVKESMIEKEDRNFIEREKLFKAKGSKIGTTYHQAYKMTQDVWGRHFFSLIF